MTTTPTGPHGTCGGFKLRVGQCRLVEVRAGRSEVKKTRGELAALKLVYTSNKSDIQRIGKTTCRLPKPKP